MNLDGRSHSDLSPAEKRRHLAALVERRARESRRELPSSDGQKALCYLQQLAPESSAYNLVYTLRVLSPVDPDAMRAALQGVVNLHPALRTTFSLQGGEPLQVVHGYQDAAFERVDLDGIDLPSLRQRVYADSKVPFDLERGPLFRGSLYTRAADDHVLLLVLHHAVCDARSVDIIVEDFLRSYASGWIGTTLAPPAREITFGDFVVWQNELVDSAEGERLRNYWEAKLAGVPDRIDLPYDRPVSDVPGLSGGSVPIEIDDRLAAQLTALACRAHVTPFCLLLSAVQALLHRYTGQDDFIVGAPTSGRTMPGLERVVGYFANPILLRANLAGNPTFLDLLARNQATVAEGLAHQDYPFPRVVQSVAAARGGRRRPLVQVLFNMLRISPAGSGDHDRGAGGPFQAGGLLLPFPVPQQEGQFDLAFEVEQSGDSFRGTLRYSTDAFAPETVHRLVGNFLMLLQGVAATPELPLFDLPILTESDLLAEIVQAPQLRILRERTARGSAGHPIAGADRPTLPLIGEGGALPLLEISVDASIGSTFSAIARAASEAVAVESDAYRWSYQELERRSNQVAHAALETLGPGAGRIALCLGHDAPMVAAIMGALKAGKTYVPLDLASPPDRLRRIFDDSQAGAILTSAALAGEVAGWRGGRPVLVLEEICALEREDALDLKVPPETPAYILYTSGSTGEPKGVVQSHRNVLHHIRTYVNRLRIGAGDRLTLLSGFGFDAAVMDLFGALLSGATLCPIDLRGQAGAALPSEVRRRAITIYHSTPSVYRHLLREADDLESFQEIRLVVLGGEEVIPRDVELFRRHFPLHARLVNGLGPTECTLALQHLIGHETELPRHRVPVGCEVEGVKVLLLNGAGEDVEAYATGEIVLRSAHLALGYWNRPEQTARAFLPDPDGGDRRLYRTGDMGRRLEDGSIEFMGRQDDQVKIRGHRVEPAEVEAALRSHEAVQDAVVLASPNPETGEMRLLAYVVAAADGAGKPTGAALRDALRGRLPEYMLPAACLVIDGIPLTENGKVDRRRLAGLAEPSASQESLYVAPSLPVEILIAEIWQDLLGVERVGATDSFFDLGGHSLLALQFAARLEQKTGVRPNLRDIAYQTLAQIAAVVARDERVAAAPWWRVVETKIRYGLQHRG